MWPELWGGIRAYPVMVGLGIVTGLSFTALCFRRARTRLGWRGIGLLVALGAVAWTGAKLESVLERGGAVLDVMAELGGGYRYLGGVLALLLAAPLLTRALGRGGGLLTITDVLMPSAAAAMVVVRLGCFLGGCCNGSVTSVPWSVRFPQGSEAWTQHVSLGWLAADAPWSLPVHPLQIYFALGSLAVAVFGWWLVPRRAYAGQVALLCIALDTGVKVGLERLRDPAVPHLRWLSLAIAAAATIALVGVELRRWVLRRDSTAKEASFANGQTVGEEM